MRSEQVDDVPDFPVAYDVLGGLALAAFIGSEVVQKPAVKRILRVVGILTGGAFIAKNYQHNEHYKRDLTGLDLPAPGGR